MVAVEANEQRKKERDEKIGDIDAVIAANNECQRIKRMNSEELITRYVFLCNAIIGNETIGEITVYYAY